MTDVGEVVAERDRAALHVVPLETKLDIGMLALLAECDEVLETEIDILPTSGLSYEERHFAAAALARRQVRGAKQIYGYP